MPSPATIGCSLTISRSISSRSVAASLPPPHNQMSLPSSCLSARTVATGSVTQSIALSGSVERVDQVTAAFRTAGTVTSVKVEVGDEVEAGADVLVERWAVIPKMTDQRGYLHGISPGNKKPAEAGGWKEPIEHVIAVTTIRSP